MHQWASSLVHSQHPSTPSFAGFLSLIALIERSSFLMAPSQVIQILDLVYSDNPVLTGESLLKRAQFRTLLRES